MWSHSPSRTCNAHKHLDSYYTLHTFDLRSIPKRQWEQAYTAWRKSDNSLMGKVQLISLTVQIEVESSQVLCTVRYPNVVYTQGNSIHIFERKSYPAILTFLMHRQWALCTWRARKNPIVDCSLGLSCDHGHMYWLNPKRYPNAFPSFGVGISTQITSKWLKIHYTPNHRSPCSA